MDAGEIIEWQRKRQDAWRSVPSEGQDVELSGLSFRVYPGVFWPFEDSLPLIENMHIEPGDEVLDMGTGAGAIAVHAAMKGARRVLAVDQNPEAIRAARVNAERHGVAQRMETRISDVFDSIGNRQFDVITANLPWLDRFASDMVEASQWDTGFATNRRFFSDLRDYLNPCGRVYIAQGNYGALSKIESLVDQNGFTSRLMAERPYSKDDSLHFYAFEIVRKRG